MAQLIHKMGEELSENFMNISEPFFGKSLLDFYKNNVVINILIGVSKRENAITGIYLEI